MATRIDDFRSKLQFGGARASQFKVSLTFPTSIGLNAGTAADSATFMCNAATLPASTINPIEVYYRGRAIKVAGERQFQNWNIRVLNDNDFKIRKVMESWSQKILQHGDVSGYINPSAYTATMLVTQLGRNDEPLRTYTFHNTFPQTVSDIQLDFQSINAIEEFTVDFSVDYWTVDSGDTQIK